MSDQPTIVESETKQDQLRTEHYFITPVYLIEKPEFLDDVAAAANDALDKVKAENPQPNEIYPVHMSGSLLADPRMEEFCSYVGSTGWNILSVQGFNMSHLRTTFHEMWCQEHYKYSGMEEHTHGHNAQLVGFYFLDTPEDCSRIVIHDPRPAKVQINLPEVDPRQATMGSRMINFAPKPGMLFFTNAWLPHSFSRNASDKPMRFVHFTLGVQNAPQAVQCDAEVV